MAQYNKQDNSFLPNGTSLFEVVMLADAEGNINTGGGNFSGAAVDAFGRARMSQPVTLFDSKNVDQDASKFYNKVTGTGTATYDITNSAVNMTVSAVGDSVLRRSKRRMAYQPGKSLQFMATTTMAEPKVGLKQRVGYYDDNDGVYFEEENGSYYIVLRSSSLGQTFRIAQNDWNGDKLNGIAADSTSGFTLNASKSQIFWSDFEWLGVGSVRCGFVINGQLIIAHTFHHANGIVGVYMKQANLNVSYEIIAGTGFTGTATMKQICASVVSEGGYTPKGQPYIASTPFAGNSTNSTGWLNLVTIKLSNLNGVAIVSGADVLNIQNEDFEWGLFRNATFATPLTFGTTLSRVAYDTTDIDLLTTGRRIAGGYLGGKTAPISLALEDWEYQLGVVDGVSETFTLAVRSSGQSKNAGGMIKWTEF